MSEKKRGGQRLPSFNVFDPIPAPSESDIDDYLSSDGKGVDYRVGPPPWGEWEEIHIKKSLARLRVDHNHRMLLAGMDGFSTGLAGMGTGERERFMLDGDCHNVGNYVLELVSICDPDEVNARLAEMKKMIENANRPPHRNFHALEAYYSFVKEFGFDPSPKKLIEYIKEHLSSFPVGIIEERSDWTTMFRESGLARLE